MHFVYLVISKTGTEKEIETIMEPYFEYGGYQSIEQMKQNPYCKFFPKIRDGAPAQKHMQIHNKQIYEDIKTKKKENKENWSWAKKENIYDSVEKFMTEWHHYILENGYWGYYENPKALWDWYQIGGRWAGLLKLKNGIKGTKGVKPNEYPWNNGRDPYEKGGYDGAKIKDVVNLTEIPLYGIIGKHSCILSEKWNGKNFEKTENWKEKKKKVIETLNPELHATIVDCHD